AGGRADHRIDSDGRTAGGIFAGNPHAPSGRDGGDDRRGVGSDGRPDGPFPDAGSLDVVRADRNCGDIRRGIRGIGVRAKDGTVNELKRELGPWTAASIVVGTVIGSGIFLVPRTMVLRVGTPELVFFVWVFGGLLS